MKLIHCADLHLDSPFSGLDAKKAEIRRDDLRKTFSALIRLTQEEKADALLIAGDLFDGKNVSKLTLDFIISKFSEIADIPVLIAAGNHDPKNTKSYYNLVDWGKNVHIFDIEPEIINIKGINILGVSFGKQIEEAPLITEQVVPASNLPLVLLMHTDLGGKDFNPVSREFIAKSNALYFAAGHIHKGYTEKIGKTLFSYPGCIEGRGFDELEKKGACVVEIDDNEANCRFISLCQRTCNEIKIDVSGLQSYEGIIGKIMLENNLDLRNLYKIVLTGEMDFVIDSSVLCDAISAFDVKIVDKTVRKTDYTAISEDYSLKGLFVKKMLEKMELEGETEELKRALGFGLAAICGEKVNP